MDDFDAMAFYASALDEENYQGLINNSPAEEGETPLVVVGPLPHDHHPLAVEPFPLVLGMFDMAEARALFGEDDNPNRLAYVLRYLSFLVRVIIRILFNFDAMDEENNDRLRSLAVIDPLVVEPLLPAGTVESAEVEENNDGLAAAESNDALAEEGFGSEDEEGWPG